LPEVRELQPRDIDSQLPDLRVLTLTLMQYSFFDLSAVHPAFAHLSEPCFLICEMETLSVVREISSQP